MPHQQVTTQTNHTFQLIIIYQSKEYILQMISIENKSFQDIEDKKVDDEHLLLYIWSVVKKFRAKKQSNSIECILCEEKLIHLSLIIFEKSPPINVEYNIKEELANFVQKINKLSMENIKDEQQGGGIKFISKAVDIIMLPEIPKYFNEDDEMTLIKLKVLTFNNLGCILKKNKHYMMALKAVSYAIDLEQNLIKGHKDEQKYDIVPTYLNKAAILSQMKKHEKALEQIRRARIYAQKIEKDVQAKLKQCKDLDTMKRLQQKRHYGLYMKMLISYNIGVEKQHQRLISSAISYYQEGKKLAIMIDNQFMAKKLEDIILKLKNQ